MNISDSDERRTLSEAERLDWLRLARSENVGPITFFALLERFGSPASVLDALPALARRGGRRRPIKVCARATAEREVEALGRLGGCLIALGEPAYPEPLAAIADPPPVIALRGRADLLAGDCVAVVGARNASANGLHFAERLAADLGEAGLTVVSGMARGIDARAHAGALATGTVAVMGGGIDVLYPKENGALFEKLLAEGTVVAEAPLGTVPMGRHFPRRNRIISGLSRGVVVVEGAARSGSLITARLALEQGREVMAVPGSPLDPRASGPNRLIRQGATLGRERRRCARSARRRRPPGARRTPQELAGRHGSRRARGRRRAGQRPRHPHRAARPEFGAGGHAGPAEPVDSRDGGDHFAGA